MLFMALSLCRPIDAGAQTVRRTERPGEAAREIPEPPRETPVDRTALDRPVDPQTYRVGPGDELAVHVWGRVQGAYTVTVSPEVSLLVPTVGEVSVRGMMLAQAKEVVLRRISDVYPGVPATVTLTRVRTLRVPVTGAVEKPGVYLVSANVRVSEAIEEAVWQDSSSHRRILLYRERDTVRVDELLFARAGDEAANPYVAEGDVIFVPEARTEHGTIEITGAVHRPDVFEHVPEDRLDEAIRLAFGFTVEADTTAVELVRFTGDDSVTAWQVIDLRESEPGKGRTVPLRPDDRIFVRPRPDFRAKAAVQVEGEVVRPGWYAVQNGQTLLSMVLQQCGGVTDHADLSRATLVRAWRFRPDVETDRRIRAIPVELQTAAEQEWMLAYSLSGSGQVSVDLQGVLSGSAGAHDMPLWDGDVITVPRYLPQINLIGRVRRPGLVLYEPGRTLDYYLERAGGLSWRADRANIFVVRGTTGMPVAKSKVKSLDAGDTIVVPTIRAKKLWPVLRDAMIVLGNMATLYLVIDQAAR